MRPTARALLGTLASAFFLSSCRATSPLSPCAQGVWRGSAGFAVTFQLVVDPACQGSPVSARVTGTGTFGADQVLVTGTQEDTTLLLRFTAGDSSVTGSFRGTFVRGDSASGTLTWASRSPGTVVYLIADSPFGMVRQ